MKFQDSRKREAPIASAHTNASRDLGALCDGHIAKEFADFDIRLGDHSETTARMLNKRWVIAFSVCDGKIDRFEEYAHTQALPAADCVSSRAIAGVPSTRAT